MFENLRNKSIVFSKPSLAELLEEPFPEFNENEVVVALECSTISSGTEKANYVGEKNLSIYNAGLPNYPIRLGYSSAGTVMSVGASVTKVKVGDRVALFWSQHTKYCKVSIDQVVKMPDNVSFSDAALTHIACFPMAAIRKCHLEIGESAVVMGQGILGQIAVKLLKCAGAAPIIAVDPVPERREKALSLGADYVLDPFDKDFIEKSLKYTNGGAAVGIEVTGVGAGLNGILDIMAQFGRVSLLGCTRNSDFTIDYYHKVHGRGITLVGAHTNARPVHESHNGWWTTPDDMAAIMTLISYNRLSLSNMVERVALPENCTEIYRDLEYNKSFPLTQFDWSEIK